jgi:gliding motility-associated-like protein
VEDNPDNFYISAMQTVDGDLGDSFTYSLVSGSGDEDNSQFYIIGDQLYIATKTNYDVKDSYTFRIRSTDSQGAFIEKIFTLTIEDDPAISKPLPSANYVSPNDDGKNDFWKIQNVAIYKDFSLTIFDQFGNVIYEKADNYNNEWDGKLNGKSLPDGNYYYIFKNEKISYKGNLTIVN